MEISVVGLGLIGGSIASCLKQCGHYINGYDLQDETIEYAMENKIIDYGSIHLKNIENSEVVILALYPVDLIKWLKDNQAKLKSNTIIIDVCGIKSLIIDEIKMFLRSDLEFVGCHPMAGKEVSGIKHSSATLYQGANYIITPVDNSDYSINIAKTVANCLQVKHISEITPKQHDEYIGFLSQLTHVIAIALMNANDNPDLALYTGDSFRDLTRIGKLNENLWTQLFTMNKDILINEIEIFEQALDKFKQALKDDNLDLMKEMMIKSTKRRQQFDKKD